MPEVLDLPVLSFVRETLARRRLRQGAFNAPPKVPLALLVVERLVR
jgi:hypothetical protein